ncbi:hypothetical protein TNIN_454821 [Trichonephila inaurata madagascariensis]|uniref:Uncharacterized protein n=1 Tax=Trichonephila inaurata madagascariensis TaxID=2747483 RepID=A0A8X6Y488_9ARAC|nr:hypothetical protein TNIN_454821 [Trichonephila inaurata madagascariensis]
MEECSETSRDAIGGSDWDWIMRVMSKKLYWDRPVKEWNLDFAIEILDRETIPNLVSYELKCQPDFNGLSLWLSESF